MSVFNPSDFAPPVAVSLQYLRDNYTTTVDLNAELEAKAPITWTGGENQNKVIFPDGLLNAFSLTSLGFDAFLTIGTVPGGLTTLQGLGRVIIAENSVGNSIVIDSEGVKMVATTQLQNLSFIAVPSNANAAAAGVREFEIYGDALDPCSLYIRTA